MKVTNTTSCSSAKTAPDSKGFVQAPELNPPPCMKTITGFEASSVCGFVQTFAVRQSSEKVSFGAPWRPRIAAPTFVTFAKALFVALSTFPPSRGHVLPCGHIDGQYGKRRLPECFRGDESPLTKSDALKEAVLEYRTGAAQRRLSTGACAKGIPRYSETSGAHSDGWPSSRPLVVFTVCPTVQVLAAKAKGSCARCARENNEMPMTMILRTTPGKTDRREIEECFPDSLRGLGRFMTYSQELRRGSTPGFPSYSVSTVSSEINEPGEW